MRRDKFLSFLESVRNIRESATDEQALSAIDIYPGWKVGETYPASDRVVYLGELYRCLQTHTSQAGWEPDVAVSLWAKVLIPDANVIPEWEQPGSTNPYMQGDKVMHNDKVWISTVDNNVWEPGVYGWEEFVK